jgi:2-C-methyl-D-erythritol 4-phosphate cytidylyltransferase
MVSVVIPASGSGTRFGGDVPKQFLHMDGLPILARTVLVFQQADLVGEIAVAVPPGYMEKTREITDIYNLTKVKYIVEGGASRSESVYEALQKLSPHTEIVLVHDGVRPFVSPDLINRVVDAARKHGAAIAGIPITDTVKEADEAGCVRVTVERGRIWQVQTPQGFSYPLLLDAYKNAPHLKGFTDDSAIVEAHGGRVYIIPGERNNIKITTPEDAAITSAMFKGSTP